MENGLAAGIVAYISASFSLEGLTLVSQTIDPGVGVGTIFTQLGVFAVVVVVFKFMLNRQDERDAQADEKDQENLTLLRQELIEERRAHEETRQKLYDALLIINERKEP